MPGAPLKPPEEGAGLKFLYGTAPGRVFLKILTAPSISRALGRLMDSRLSKPLIGPFVKRNSIDMGGFLQKNYTSFNDFFTRDVRPGGRPIDRDPAALIAPCDGLLSAYEISDTTVLPVKHCSYTLGALLRDEDVARRFEGGVCLVFRLCPRDFHRYCYVDSGVKGPNVRLPGVLHTVRPVALEGRPVFTENSREYTRLLTQNFGNVVQMEVGAMFVGRIMNHHGPGTVERGQEKGMFLFGGSTVIVLLQKGAANIEDAILSATRRGLETPVKMGERIGMAAERAE